MITENDLENEKFFLGDSFLIKVGELLEECLAEADFSDFKLKAKVAEYLYKVYSIDYSAYDEIELLEEAQKYMIKNFNKEIFVEDI